MTYLIMSQAILLPVGTSQRSGELSPWALWVVTSPEETEETELTLQACQAVRLKLSEVRKASQKLTPSKSSEILMQECDSALPLKKDGSGLERWLTG